jgi:hypothetical protein
VPTWFSSVLLLVAALLAGLCARARLPGGGRRAWWGLAVVMALFSADEIVQLHERMSLWFSFGGVLTFGWVVPAGAFVLVFGLCYLPFLLRQPRPVRNGLILAGALYVGGALLMELPLGAWTAIHGNDNLVYALIDDLEEALEMLGVIAFILTTLGALEAAGSTLRLTGSSPPGPENGGRGTC